MIYKGDKVIKAIYKGDNFVSQLSFGKKKIVYETGKTRHKIVSDKYFILNTNNMSSLISRYPALSEKGYLASDPVYHVQIKDESFEIPSFSGDENSWYNYEAYVDFKDYCKKFCCFIGRDKKDFDSTLGRSKKPTKEAHLRIYRIRDNKLLADVEIRLKGRYLNKYAFYGYKVIINGNQVADDNYTGNNGWIEPGKMIRFEYNKQKQRIEVFLGEDSTTPSGESDVFKFEPLRVKFTAFVGGWRHDEDRREGWFLAPRNGTTMIKGYEK